MKKTAKNTKVELWIVNAIVINARNLIKAKLLAIKKSRDVVIFIK